MGLLGLVWFGLEGKKDQEAFADRLDFLCLQPEKENIIAAMVSCRDTKGRSSSGCGIGEVLADAA